MSRAREFIRMHMLEQMAKARIGTASLVREESQQGVQASSLKGRGTTHWADWYFMQEQLWALAETQKLAWLMMGCLATPVDNVYESARDQSEEDDTGSQFKREETTEEESEDQLGHKLDQSQYSNIKEHNHRRNRAHRMNWHGHQKHDQIMSAIFCDSKKDHAISYLDWPWGPRFNPIGGKLFAGIYFAGIYFAIQKCQHCPLCAITENGNKADAADTLTCARRFVKIKYYCNYRQEYLPFDL